MEQFRPKSEEELKEQVESAEAVLGKELTQPSSRDEAFELSAQELKEKYPRRYNIYLQLLRAKRAEDEPSKKRLERMREMLRILNSLDDYIEAHENKSEGRTLREKQITVFDAMRDALEEGETEGYVKLPTGVGKTVLFSEFLEALNTKTVIAVPTLTLVDQTIKKLQRFAPGMESGSVSGRKKELDSNVIVITYASLVNEVARGNIDPKQVGLLILDEAHRSLSDLRSDTVGKFTNAIKLGFTATPTFSSDKEVGHLLSRRIYSMEIPEAVDEGLLAPFAVTIVKTNTDLSKVKITGGDYSDDDLEKAINIESRNKAAVKLYKETFKTESGVAFCVGVDHAEQVAKLFNNSGISAAVITGRTEREEEQRILEQYRHGEIKMLCTADKLIEGFDEPRASVCLNLRPTLSRIIAEQRAGRVLRLDENNPEKFAHVIEFLDGTSLAGFSDTVTFAAIVESAKVTRNKQFTGLLDRQPYSMTEETTDDEKEGEETPRLPNIRIEGLEVVSDAKEVMRIVSAIEKAREEKMSIAPPGWQTRSGLAAEIGVSFDAVQAIAETYRNTNPAWFVFYKGSGRGARSAEHMHPDLVAIITEEALKIPAAPKGWLTAAATGRAIGMSDTAAKKQADSYRAEHPEWFREYRDVAGRPNEHFAPELIHEMRQEFKAIEKAPKGWRTVNTLAKYLEVGSKVVARLAEQQRAAHPEWFKKMRDERSRPFEFLAPPLVKMISKEILSVDPAPPGWQTLNAIYRDTGISPDKARRVAAEFLEQEPTMEEYFRESSGQKGLHYAPELIEIIQDIVELEKKGKR